MPSPVRKAHLGPAGAIVTRREDGSLLLRSPHELGPYQATLTDRLVHWAAAKPDDAFLARRGPGGAWRIVTYRAALLTVERIGRSLLHRGLSAERPIAILSDNDIEHALLGLAALHVGIPYAPISPAYSLLSTDHAKLRQIMAVLTPGLVFAAEGARYAAAIAAAVPPDAEIVVTDAPPAGRAALSFADLQVRDATPDVAAAHRATGPDTVAKILFTSGSTGVPKGVINTQRMLCSNQQMLLSSLPFLAETPPVIVDWLPWNHTFGGNHNVGIVLHNGGTLYIDDGRPVPGRFEPTVENLREIAPTVFFNVPKGFEMLVPYLRREKALRDRFFSRVQMMFYAGAGLSQHVWDALDELAVEACGERIMMITGLGATETAPYAIAANWDGGLAGGIGLPVPGLDLKLTPVGHKLEARVKGPNVTPGYWRQPEATRAAFDDEGYYRMGDAVRFLDDADPQKGLVFDGRLAEDFKLGTGTWVSAGPLRAQVILHFAPCIRDVVIAGENRDDVGVLIFPDLATCRGLCADLAPGASDAEMLGHHAVRDFFQGKLDALAAAGTGSSNRVVRAVLCAEPPAIDAHEMTDKGSLNARAVLARRAALVDALYAPEPAPSILIAATRRR